MNTVALYSRFAVPFGSACEYENPVQDFAVEVEFKCAGTRVIAARAACEVMRARHTGLPARTR